MDATVGNRGYGVLLVWPVRLVAQNADGQCVLEAHEDLPVKVRPKEGPSRLCSSPPAFGETPAFAGAGSGRRRAGSSSPSFLGQAL